MAEAEQSFIVKVPRNFNERARDVLAEEIIFHVRQRTKNGLDIDNKPFIRYSKAYKESNEFTATGKSSSVDLTLTDDMLSSMVVKSSGVGFIRIGMSDTFANDKAAWNKQDGRAFLGISSKDLASIVTRVRNALGIKRGLFG